MTAKLYKSFFYECQSHRFFSRFFRFFTVFCDIFQTASIHQSIEIDNQKELGRRAVFFFKQRDLPNWVINIFQFVHI